MTAISATINREQAFVATARTMFTNTGYEILRADGRGFVVQRDQKYWVEVRRVTLGEEIETLAMITSMNAYLNKVRGPSLLLVNVDVPQSVKNDAFRSHNVVVWDRADILTIDADANLGFRELVA